MTTGNEKNLYPSITIDRHDCSMAKMKLIKKHCGELEYQLVCDATPKFRQSVEHWNYCKHCALKRYHGPVEGMEKRRGIPKRKKLKKIQNILELL